MIGVYTVLYLLSSLFILYNISKFISLITNSNIRIRASVYLLTYIICSAMYVFCSTYYNYPVIDLILFLLNCILLFFCIYKNFLFYGPVKIAYIVLLYLLLDSVLTSIFQFILSIFFENHVDYLIELFISIVNCIIILIFNIILAHKKEGMYFQTNSIPKHVYILILFALFFGGGLIEIQLLLTNTSVQNVFNRYITVIVIILLIFIIISLVFACISKSCLENTSLLLEKLNLSQVEHFQELNKLYGEIRKFKHDYRNHLICLQALVEGEQYYDVKQYIQEITHKEFIASEKFFTGNQIADAILSDKSANAEKINAEIKFDGTICDKIPLTDICVILSNALDNAIEACEKITTSDKKIIEVNCIFSQNVQLIYISNPVEEDVQINNNTVNTTKNDKSSHGIGLYNIKRTIDKYSGKFDITCENNKFILDIGFQVCSADVKEPIHD